MGPGVFPAGRETDMVRYVPVDAGPNIAVPVNVGPGVVPAGREIGTVRDVPVDAELPVQREVNAGGVKFAREIGTEVDAVRGVPVVPVDSVIEGKW